MTTEEARQHLERVEKGLQCIAVELVNSPSSLGDLHSRLEELAQVFSTLYQQGHSFRDSKPVICLLRTIQAHLRRVQMLLDTALSFYSGAISVAVSQAGPYTARGELPRPAGHGYLELKA